MSSKVTTSPARPPPLSSDMEPQPTPTPMPPLQYAVPLRLTPQTTLHISLQLPSTHPGPTSTSATTATATSNAATPFCAPLLLHLTTLSTSQTGSSPAGQLAPMGAFVYAIPGRARAAGVGAGPGPGPGPGAKEVLSTVLYTGESVDRTVRCAKMLARVLERPVYVSDSMGLEGEGDGFGLGPGLDLGFGGGRGEEGAEGGPEMEVLRLVRDLVRREVRKVEGVAMEKGEV